MNGIEILDKDNRIESLDKHTETILKNYTIDLRIKNILKQILNHYYLIMRKYKIIMGVFGIKERISMHKEKNQDK